MIVPGSNLLSAALKLIAQQTGTLYRNKGVIDGDDGINNPTYQPGQPIIGSEQAVSQRMYVDLGLDLQKEYITFYTSTRLQDTQRDKCPDLIDFNGWRYKVESNTNWRNQDGWQASILVRQGAAR